MNEWVFSKNKALILFTLKNGVFQERLLAIKALKELNDETPIPYLLQTAKKDYKEIAMNALNLISLLDKNKRYTKEVEVIKQIWKAEQERKENRVISFVKKDKVSKHNRMQALDRLKQQLKRPIAGGKWF